MKSLIFDTGALVQSFSNNRQVKIQLDLVKQKRTKGYVIKPILAEFFYKTCETNGLEIARIRTISILRSEIEIIPLSDKLIFEAGRIKCQNRFVSFADSLAVALTLITKGVLVTTDEKLKEIRKLKILKINY